MHKFIVALLLFVATFALFSEQQSPVVTDVRTAYAFGSNLRGQLGFVNARVLQRVLSTANVKDFCVSPDHIVAVTTTNQIFAWGVNNGQFGNFNGSLIDTPQQISTTLTTVDQVSCGNSHSLARSGSTVHAVGFNNFAQLGYTDTSVRNNALLASSTAVNGLAFTSLFAAGSTSYGLTATGQLYSWGFNGEGQTGVDSGVQNFVSTPTLVASAGTVTDLAASADFVVALNNAGSVLVAGSNAVGQLAVGSAIPPRRSSFAAVTLPATVTKIAVGGNSILALGSNGRLYGWGENTCAQLATTNATSFFSPIELDISMLDSAIAHMAITAQYALIITTSGKFYLAGRSSFGYALPTDRTCLQIASPRFQLVSTYTLPTGATSVLKLLANIDNFVLLTNNNQLFVTGTTRKSGLGARASQAMQLSMPSNLKFDRMYAGNQMSLAFEANTGLTYAWGRNADLGIVSTDSIDVFVPTRLTHSNITNVNVTDIFVSGNTINNNIYWNIMFVRNDSRVLFGYGRNDVGQLATGQQLIDPVSVPIQVDISNDTRIAKLQGGVYHTIYLGTPVTTNTPTAAQVTMYGFGNNAEGQLGLSQVSNRPTRFRLRNGVRDIATGDFHTVYVDTNNVISVMGDNSKGQLGIGFINRRSDPTPINSTRYAFLSNSTAVNLYGCSEGTFIITTLGWVAFGDNSFGALGLGSAITQVNEPTEHTILNGLIPNPASTVYKMSCARNGGKHALILLKTGEVWGFGRNDNGQLGLGDFINRFTPVKITLPTNIRALDISAGTDHSLVLIGQKSCPNDCNLNRGTCDTVQGICNCFEEYTGFDCSLFNCASPLCNSRGTCDQTQGICVCQTGFSGHSCQFRRCPNNCNGNGECDRIRGVCTCDPGWSGEDCGNSSSPANSISVSMWFNALVTLLVALVAHALC